MNIQVILTVMNTTELEAKMRPGKIQVTIEFEPMTSAVEETNIEAILAVMNTTELVVEMRPEKKFGPVRDLTSAIPVQRYTN